MLTIDDVNTIIEKYGKSGFWYTIDLGKLNFENMPSSSSGRWFNYDGIRIHANAYPPNDPMTISIYFSDRNYTTRIGYLSYDQGETSTVEGVDWWSNRIVLAIDKTILKNNPPIFYLYITTNPTTLPNNANLYRCLFVPISSLQIPVINGEFDNKLYIKVLGDLISAYTINGNSVTLEEDEKGKFFNLPSATDCIIGTKYNTVDFPLYRVTFNEFKSVPLMNVSMLYRGTPQTITITNESTGEPITDFQAYYQGRLLKNNKITLPYDAPDIIDITIDLFESEYPESTIKLKANTEVKLCTSVAQITSAIEQGIQTLQVHNPSNGDLIVRGLTFESITFIDSKIRFRECTLNNVTITQTEEYHTGSITLITGTVLDNCTLQNLNTLRISSCELNSCILKEIDSVESYNYPDAHELVMTGTITDCTLKAIIVFSDGDIALTNNTFTMKSSKEHFPNFLYLTGDYTVTNNTFTLNDEWEELAFNMCIIKADNTFNPSAFINNNTLNLNIVYGEESPNTFYYNIVDDDKIRAVRLE